jgi:predicted deacylase
VIPLLVFVLGLGLGLASFASAEAPAAPEREGPPPPAVAANADAPPEPSVALATNTPSDEPRAAAEGSAAKEGEADPVAPPGPLQILGESVEPGSVARLLLRSSESFSGARVETPVVVVHGREPGPALCVVAGIHGDEVNGVEVVRRVLFTLDPKNLRGVVIAIPIANLSAFRRSSRYLPDRRDLNRYFPGRPNGSSASRIAHGLFDDVVRHCDALVDLHTGSFHRTNLHQIRANLSDEGTAQLAAAFGAEVVVNSAGRAGTLRRAATDAGIPAITVEAGEPARFEEEHVVEALEGVRRLLSARGMLTEARPHTPRTSANAYLRTRWVRCDQGGILVSRVGLGEKVEAGQILGTISDPLSDEIEGVVSPLSGRVIGMALDQLVMPGFAAYHIGYDPRPLGSATPTMIEESEVALEIGPEGLDLEERPE